MGEKRLTYTIYINAAPDAVWEAMRRGEPVVSAVPGTEFRTDYRPGSSYAYAGKKPDGEPIEYVRGKILAAQRPVHLEMTYATPAGAHESHIVYRLDEIAGKYTKLSVVQDGFTDDDPNYAINAEGWPQLLSNLKSLLETGTIMHYHG